MSGLNVKYYTSEIINEDNVVKHCEFILLKYNDKIILDDYDDTNYQKQINNNIINIIESILTYYNSHNCTYNLNFICNDSIDGTKDNRVRIIVKKNDDDDDYSISTNVLENAMNFISKFNMSGLNIKYYTSEIINEDNVVKHCEFILLKYNDKIILDDYDDTNYQKQINNNIINIIESILTYYNSHNCTYNLNFICNDSIDGTKDNRVRIIVKKNDDDDDYSISTNVLENAMNFISKF